MEEATRETAGVTFTVEEMRANRAIVRQNKAAAERNGDKKYKGCCRTHGWTDYYNVAFRCCICSLEAGRQHRAAKGASYRKREVRRNEDSEIKSIRYAAITRPGGELVWYYAKDAASARGRKEWRKEFGHQPLHSTVPGDR